MRAWLEFDVQFTLTDLHVGAGADATTDSATRPASADTLSGALRERFAQLEAAQTGGATPEALARVFGDGARGRERRLNVARFEPPDEPRTAVRRRNRRDAGVGVVVGPELFSYALPTPGRPQPYRAILRLERLEGEGVKRLCADAALFGLALFGLRAMGAHKAAGEGAYHLRRCTLRAGGLELHGLDTPLAVIERLRLWSRGEALPMERPDPAPPSLETDETAAELREPYRVMVYALQPLRFTRNAIYNELDTFEFIPGRSLAAALAGAARRLWADDPRTRRLGGAVSEAGSLALTAFGDLHPIGQPRDLYGAGTLPRTAFTARRAPGFKSIEPEDELEAGAGVVDSLAARLASDGRDQPFHPQHDLPSLGGALEPASGSYAWRGDSVYGKRARLEIQTRNRNDPGRGASLDQALFTVREIAPRQAFLGQAWLTLSEFRAVREVLRAGMSDNPGWAEAQLPRRYEVQGILEQLGARGRSHRGLVVVGLERLDPGRHGQAIEERLRTFQARLGTRDDVTRLVPITLESPALFSDTARRSILNPEPRALHAAFGGADLAWWSVGSSVVAGHRADWGLPAATQLAVAPGSVWVVRLENGADAPKIAWALERDGVGLDTTQGFGRVRVAHQIHLWEGVQ